VNVREEECIEELVGKIGKRNRSEDLGFVKKISNMFPICEELLAFHEEFLSKSQLYFGT
jgi:hypothetical protein